VDRETRDEEPASANDEHATPEGDAAEDMAAQGVLEGSPSDAAAEERPDWIVAPADESLQDQSGTGGGVAGQETGDRQGAGGGQDGQAQAGMPGEESEGSGRKAHDGESVEASESGTPAGTDADTSPDSAESGTAQVEAAPGEAAIPGEPEDVGNSIDAAAAAAAAEKAMEAARNINAAFEPDPDVVDAEDVRGSRGGHFEPWHRDVRGVWELESIDDPAADFLPSGAARRLIGIDPIRRELNVYVAIGAQPWEWQSVAYEVAFRREVVEIDVYADRPSGFTGNELLPPATDLPCESVWSRQGERLHLAGAVYVPSDPEEVLRIMEPPESEPPIASDLEGSAGQSAAAADAPPTVDFFGVQSQGRYVAYILDVSRSMRGRMARLQGELEMSLGSLPGNARFVVLPFNSSLLKLQPHWAVANKANVKKVGRSLADVAAQGGTDPAEAFEWAFRTLNPRPDESYFMTDGAVARSQQLIKRLRQLNAGTGKTRIHAIGLGGNAETGFLRAVAGEHGGRFVHITR